MNKNKSLKINRRNFIEKATIASLGLSATLSACTAENAKNKKINQPVFGKAPDGKILRIGLIGCGNRGMGAVYNFLKAANGIEIVSLADIFADKIEFAKELLVRKGISVNPKNCFTGFDAYNKLLETNVDIVILATPPQFRPLHIKSAVEAGKHIFAEKPMAVDPVGVRSVLASAKQAASLKLNVLTGTQRRHQKDYIETYNHISNGAIGKIVSGKAFWNQSHVWFKNRQPEWTDMEYMLRNWNNFCWLSGDQIVENHVHNLDVINWFTGKYPQQAIGYGGRHHRSSGDQYDFFSIDYDYGDGLYIHSMCRQIDNCADGVGEFIMGTKGYTNCINTIYNLDGSIKWQYNYPYNSRGIQFSKMPQPPYVQELVDFVTVLRTDGYLNELERTAYSTLGAIMGRTAAYTGKNVTWDEVLNSELSYGMDEYHLGNINVEFKVPKPGTSANKETTRTFNWK